MFVSRPHVLVQHLSNMCHYWIVVEYMKWFYPHMYFNSIRKIWAVFQIIGSVKMWGIFVDTRCWWLYQFSPKVLQHGHIFRILSSSQWYSFSAWEKGNKFQLCMFIDGGLTGFALIMRYMKKMCGLCREWIYSGTREKNKWFFSLEGSKSSSISRWAKR